MRRQGALVLVLACAAIAGGCDDSEDSGRANEELAKARSQANAELTRARDEIREERAAAEEELAETRRAIKKEKRKLARLQEEVDQTEDTIAKSTIPGDGTFEVGTDIEPGTYRAEAMPGCYWARLSSLDTSDIIDNNNADGPVVLEILPSDKALQLQGCAEFRKAE